MDILNIIFMLLPFAIMLGAGVVVPLLAWMFYYRFEYGLALIAFIWMMEAFFMGLGGFYLGISLYYTDIVLLLIAVVAVLRVLLANDFPRRHEAWAWFSAMICVSLLTGLFSFGSTAGVQARQYFYLMVSALYAMSFPMDEKRVRLALNAMVICALALVALSIYRWVVYYTPIYTLLPEGGVYNIDGPMRVIHSNFTLLIAQVLVAGIFISAAARGLKVAQFLSPLLLAAVIALQHRSVWLAAIVGILSILTIIRSRSASPFSQLLTLVSILALTALPMMMSDKFSEVGRQVTSSAAHGLAGEGTVRERSNSWKEIIGKWYSAGPRSILIGQSFGSDNSRYVPDPRGGSRKIDYAAHNMYVQTLFNTGLLGLGAFLAANAFVITGLYRIRRQARGGVEATVLLVLIIMQLVYNVAYQTDYLQSMLFGVALAYVVCKSRKVETAETLLPTEAKTV